jgi:DNA-binding response OmpR family regulator
MTQGNIVIIDNDAVTLQTVTPVLRAAGYHVSSAQDAISAMVTVRRVKPDLVILDLVLPAGDGFTVLEQLQAYRPSDPIPAIVLTARDPNTSWSRAQAAGAVAFLQKPVNHEELLATVQAYVSKPHVPAKQVLIVEDDPTMQKVLATLLRASGFVTNLAADGATAMQVAAHERPDVIVLDLGLPVGDGFAVMQRLAMHPTLNDVPVIVVTGRDVEVNRPRALQAGAVAFFEKPPNFDELLHAIHSVSGGAAAV